VQNSFVAVVSVRLIFPTRAKYFPKNCLGFNWKKKRKELCLCWDKGCLSKGLCFVHWCGVLFTA
jgi:hypothetical protein